MIQRILSRACPPDKNISMAGIERMGDRELQTLRDWIAAGAPEVKQALKPQQVDPKPESIGRFNRPNAGNAAGEGGRSRG